MSTQRIDYFEKTLLGALPIRARIGSDTTFLNSLALLLHKQVLLQQMKNSFLIVHDAPHGYFYRGHLPTIHQS